MSEEQSTSTEYKDITELAYTRADVEAAVKRALEGAVTCCEDELRNTAMLLSNPPKSSAAWDAANSIRRLASDPAQFIEGEKR